MELIFLKRSNLAILDHAIVSDEFTLIMDSVVNQKSSFTVNKTSINASIGDIVILRDTAYFYIGIVEAIERTNDFQTSIDTNDFTSMFDIQVPVTSYSGDVCLLLMNLIRTAFKNNIDPLQNLSYLSVIKSATVQGTLNYDGTELVSITSISEVLSKTYGVRFNYSLVLDIQGRITGIQVEIANVTLGLKIKSNLPCITELQITDSKNQVTNKVVFYPKDDNVSYRGTVTYYLLIDGTITYDRNDENRYNYVKSICEFYSDNEYDSLLTKAQSKLLKSNLEHSIEFKINMNNQILVPFVNLKLGDFVEFIAGTKTYDTMVTQLSFTGNFYECSVVLGEYRVKLTDKIKLLERK